MITDRLTDTLVERLANQDEMNRAVTQVVEEAVRRHKEMGKSIAVWQDGRVVIVPSEEIVLLEDTQPDTEPTVSQIVQISAR